MINKYSVFLFLKYFNHLYEKLSCKARFKVSSTSTEYWRFYETRAAKFNKFENFTVQYLTQNVSNLVNTLLLLSKYYLAKV